MEFFSLILFCLLGRDLLFLLFPFLQSTNKISTCNNIFEKMRFFEDFFFAKTVESVAIRPTFLSTLYFLSPFFRGNAVVYFANCRKKLFPAGRGREGGCRFFCSDEKKCFSAPPRFPHFASCVQKMQKISPSQPRKLIFATFVWKNCRIKSAKELQSFYFSAKPSSRINGKSMSFLYVCSEGSFAKNHWNFESKLAE